jgi:hypothetical protein
LLEPANRNSAPDPQPSEYVIWISKKPTGLVRRPKAKSKVRQVVLTANPTLKPGPFANVLAMVTIFDKIDF